MGARGSPIIGLMVTNYIRDKSRTKTSGKWEKKEMQGNRSRWKLKGEKKGEERGRETSMRESI